MANKAKAPPYIGRSNVNAFFDRMQNLAPPNVVDADWVKSYELAKQPSAIVNMLSWLGVADDDGNIDSEQWNRLRANHRDELANLVKTAYSDIFDQIDDVTSASRDDLHGAFVTAYGLGDTTRYITSFRALCERAGLLPAASKGRSSTGQTQKAAAARGPSKHATQAKKSAHTAKKQADQGKPSTPVETDYSPQISLNLEIPAEWTEEQIRERLESVLRVLRKS